MAISNNVHCLCGEVAVAWRPDGTGHCKKCAEALTREMLGRGESVTIAVKGKPTWKITPLCVANGHADLCIFEKPE